MDERTRMGETVSNELDPPPTTEEEEVKRRTIIPLIVLIRWYREQGLPLDVPLRDYRPRGSNGESS